MPVKNQKELNLEILPEEAKKELLDFYEYLLNKYRKVQKQGIVIKEEKAVELDKKRRFFESVKKHSFILPEDYRFNREKLHER